MTGIIINNNLHAINSGNSEIEYSTIGGESISYSVYGENIPVMCTFTINAIPNDALILINGQATNTITAYQGTTINWSVSKSGYFTQTGTYVLTSNHIENVTLDIEWVDLSFYSFGNLGTFTSQGDRVIESRWRNMLKNYTYTYEYDLNECGCVMGVGYQMVWFTYSKPIYIEYLKICGCQTDKNYCSSSDKMGYSINDGSWHYTSLSGHQWGARNHREEYNPASFIIQNTEVTKLGFYIYAGNRYGWSIMYIQSGDTPILKQRA